MSTEFKGRKKKKRQRIYDLLKAKKKNNPKFLCLPNLKVGKKRNDKESMICLKQKKNNPKFLCLPNLKVGKKRNDKESMICLKQKKKQSKVSLSTEFKGREKSYRAF